MALLNAYIGKLDSPGFDFYDRENVILPERISPLILNTREIFSYLVRRYNKNDEKAACLDTLLNDFGAIMTKQELQDYFIEMLSTYNKKSVFNSNETVEIQDILNFINDELEDEISYVLVVYDTYEGDLD